MSCYGVCILRFIDHTNCPFLLTGEIFYVNRLVWASPSYKMYIYLYQNFGRLIFFLLSFVCPCIFFHFTHKAQFPTQKGKKKRNFW